MEVLDTIYLRILEDGLDATRDAAAIGDLPRCRAELEHLHNLPTLIGEANIHRHLYYISAEKTAYLGCVLRSKQMDWKEFVAVSYLPQWRKIEEILEVDKIVKDRKEHGAKRSLGGKDDMPKGNEEGNTFR